MAAKKHRGNKATVAQHKVFMANHPELGAQICSIFPNQINFRNNDWKVRLIVGDGAGMFGDDSVVPTRKVVKGSPEEIAEQVVKLLA